MIAFCAAAHHVKLTQERLCAVQSARACDTLQGVSRYKTCHEGECGLLGGRRLEIQVCRISLSRYLSKGEVLVLTLRHADSSA